MNRRRFVSGSAALAATSVLPACSDSTPAAIDLADPQDNLRAWMKVYSDINGHVDVYSGFSGHIFAVIGDAKPLDPLLGFEGFAVNRIVPQDDGSFKAFINEVAFYKDPRTDEIIDVWDNPFTGERVDVFQLHAGPLTSHVTTSRKFEQEDGSFIEMPFLLPWYVQGNDAFISIEFNDVRDNPLQPDEWPRESVGEKIRVSESMQFMTKMDQLNDPNVTRVNSTMSWTLLRSWLPWMLMGRTPGHLYYRNIVQKVAGLDNLPGRIVAETEKRFPAYLVSPPDESFGAFETSYKVYKAERTPMPVE